MKARGTSSDDDGFAIFSLFDDIAIGVIGALVGVEFGQLEFPAVCRGFWMMLVTAGVGAFFFLFAANIIHVVVGPDRH